MKLVLDGICKSFGATRALQDIRLELYGGEIHALMGVNGAGKSTLMKILAGAVQAEAGMVSLDSHLLHLNSPLEAQAAGINLIYQQPNLVPNLSVAENIWLAHEPKKGLWLDQAKMNIEAERLLERLHAKFSSNTAVRELGMADRQIVEIAKALRHQGRVLLLDEPTAALSHLEIAALFDILLELRSQGIAILYASHRLSEVYALANRVSVLRGGRCICTLEQDEIRTNTIISRMLGQPPRAKKPRSQALQPPSVILQTTDLSDGKLEPMTLQLHSGEILGIAGLLGSGRSELAQLLSGASKAQTGQLKLHGQPVYFSHPADAIRAGIAYVPEKLFEQGIFANLNAEDNVTIPLLKQHTRFGFLKLNEVKAHFQSITHDLPIRLETPSTLAQHLSFGTQRKLLIARWLALRPSVLILDEPMGGIDVAAKAEIEDFIAHQAEQGCAVLLISSEFTDLERLCHRVLIMREGRLIAELNPQRGDHLSDLEMMAMAAGTPNRIY
jgi:ribose transport system ATP-binding protein